jgi:hypothetical protein
LDNITDIFKIISGVNSPWGLASLFGFIFFLAVRILLKKEHSRSGKLWFHIVNLLFILCLISLVIVIFSLFISNQPSKETKVTLKGTVFVDGKPTKNITVKVLEIEKEVETNSFGFFSVEFYVIDSSTIYNIEFFNREMGIDTTLQVQNDSLKRTLKFPLSSKRNLRNNISKKTSKTKESIHVNPSGIPSLENDLSQHGYILSNISAKYNVELRYSGRIENVITNLYRYNGGYICIWINGNECAELKQLRITKTFYGGNSLQFVDSVIDSQIRDISSRQVLTVSEKIRRCLK